MSPSAGPCEWLLAEASTHLLRSTAVRTPNYHVLRAQSIVRSFTISYDFHVPIFAWTETLSQKVCYWMIQPSRPSLLCRYGLCLVGHVMLWISSSKFANAWAKDIRTDSYSAETVRSFSMGPLEKTWKTKGTIPWVFWKLPHALQAAARRPVLGVSWPTPIRWGRVTEVNLTCGVVTKTGAPLPANESLI